MTQKPRDDMDWQYVIRKDWGRELTNTEVCVVVAIRCIKEYTKEQRLIKAANKSNDSKNDIKANRKTRMSKSKKGK